MSVCVMGKLGLMQQHSFLFAPSYTGFTKNYKNSTFQRRKLIIAQNYQFYGYFCPSGGWRGRIRAGKKRGGGSAANCPYNGFPGLHQAIFFSYL